MIELLNIDCMEYMATLPDKAFDLAVVDPPYGIGVNSMKMGDRKTIKPDSRTWDNEIPNQKYFNEIFRISKYQIIWGGNYFPLPTSKSFIIWDKGETMYGRDFAECEFAWVTSDKPAKIFKKSPNQLNRIHPTQKPIALYKWILHNYAKTGDRILDTHLGSGSSAIAAHNMGFDFVGCELDKDYYDAACKRFKEQTKQLSLL